MKVIMWDVDDVFNDLMGDWFRQAWLPDHSECTVEYADLTQNPPHEILGSSKQEYLESLDNFRLKSFSSLKPCPETLEWFRQHGEKATHIVVTSVPLKSAHLSADWVFSHFGQWIRSFNIVPSYRKGDREIGFRTKAEFIKTFSKVDIVVEDNPEIIASMKGFGISTVTIPRPWNHSEGTILDSLKELNYLIRA